MNREKIEKALKQIDIALTAINDENFPEFTNTELDCDYESWSLQGSKIYKDISKAYQLIDNISYELTVIMEEE